MPWGVPCRVPCSGPSHGGGVQGVMLPCLPYSGVSGTNHEPYRNPTSAPNLALKWSSVLNQVITATVAIDASYGNPEETSLQVKPLQPST